MRSELHHTKKTWVTVRILLLWEPLGSNQPKEGTSPFSIDKSTASDLILVWRHDHELFLCNDSPLPWLGISNLVHAWVFLTAPVINIFYHPSQPYLHKMVRIINLPCGWTPSGFCKAHGSIVLQMLFMFGFIIISQPYFSRWYPHIFDLSKPCRTSSRWRFVWKWAVPQSWPLQKRNVMTITEFGMFRYQILSTIVDLQFPIHPINYLAYLGGYTTWLLGDYYDPQNQDIY